ncbi:cell wall-binding repeat-containing protein [Peptacetobacter hiranonis]|uniref:cell wall-binding repeat-containing protein n=1 Tax=Peptacetobacter hiranonis TaxID=89152 RepID=UPI0022E18D90|nr:cell wall-binding repeat-containing protein [Peptacetobacter hiranonis]
MKFKEKASSLALCAVLLGTSIAPVSAATQTSIIGANRYDTAAKIADNMGNYDTAILVNADKSLADGLSASSLAGKENAPILLVKKDSIPKETLSRLQKVKKVYIIGGTAAVSSNVTNQLAGKEITRIEGSNRIETSENVAKLVGNYNEAFIVNGNKGEADAMSVASVAARDKAPIILTNGTSSTQNKKSGVKYFVVGGEAVVSNSLVNKFGAVRLSGSDRYKTNRAVVQKFYPNPGKLYYTKGNPLVDALTVSSLAKNDGVVLVSPKSDNSILKGKNTVQVGGMNFSVNPSEDSKPVITSKVDRVEFAYDENVDFQKFGLTATDKTDGDITDKIVTYNLPNLGNPGEYKITFSVTNSKGIEATKTVTVVILDRDAQKPDGEKPDNGQSDLAAKINSPAYQAEYRAEFYKLINQHRASDGLYPYEVESSMEELSYLKSKHMEDLNYFAHDYDDSKTQYYKDRWRHGTYPYLMITEIYPNIAKVIYSGENIYKTWNVNLSAKELAEVSFNKWKASNGHNQAMLSKFYKYVGVGVYSDGNTICSTTEFGE